MKAGRASKQRLALERPPPRPAALADTLTGGWGDPLLIGAIGVAAGVAAELGILDEEGTPVGLRLMALFFVLMAVGSARRRRRAGRLARHGSRFEGVVTSIDAEDRPSFEVQGPFGVAYCGPLDTDLEVGAVVDVLVDSETGDVGAFTGKRLAMRNPPRLVRLTQIAVSAVVVLGLLLLWLSARA